MLSKVHSFPAANPSHHSPPLNKACWHPSSWQWLPGQAKDWSQSHAHQGTCDRGPNKSREKVTPSGMIDPATSTTVPGFPYSEKNSSRILWGDKDSSEEDFRRTVLRGLLRRKLYRRFFLYYHQSFFCMAGSHTVVTWAKSASQQQWADPLRQIMES